MKIKIFQDEINIKFSNENLNKGNINSYDLFKSINEEETKSFKILGKVSFGYLQ